MLILRDFFFFFWMKWYWYCAFFKIRILLWKCLSLDVKKLYFVILSDNFFWNSIFKWYTSFWLQCISGIFLDIELLVFIAIMQYCGLIYPLPRKYLQLSFDNFWFILVLWLSGDIIFSLLGFFLLLLLVVNVYFLDCFTREKFDLIKIYTIDHSLLYSLKKKLNTTYFCFCEIPLKKSCKLLFIGAY